MGYLDAIDVWGYVSQGVDVCIPQLGYVVFLDATTAPRSVRAIPFTHVNGFTCAHLNSPGTIVLVQSGALSLQPSIGLPGALPDVSTGVGQPTVPAPRGPTVSLTNCVVNTTDYLNMRNAPAGDQILTVFLPNVILDAVQRTANWYQVFFDGGYGWVSADFVTPIGNCQG